LNEDTARVTVRYCDQSQMVAFTVDTEGRPVTAVFQSRSNANPDEMHGLQPFGAVMSGFRDVGDYRPLFRVEAGNNYGTDAHFPFFIADVQDIRFTGAEL
jgi:hypothetical protein